MYELLLQFDQRAAAMEPHEVMGPEASWSAFDSAMSVDESEAMAQLFGSRGFSGSQDQQMLWPDHDGNAYDFSHDRNCYPDQWPQGNCSTCKDDAPAANYEGYYLSYPHEVPAVSVCSGPMNFSIGGVQIDAPSVPAGAYSAVCLNEARRDDDETGSCKRKGRASASVLKKGRDARAKKAQSENTCNDEERNGDTNPQSSCCYCSEEDGSQELNAAGTSATALNLNGKKQAASRGSATDPQSLYARKRRERINGKLRILQNLIPNGTKVDISTMLEEAVQYVKFLQLQIKLLSSDELWMYAPIAYNGVNLGFDLEI